MLWLGCILLCHCEILCVTKQLRFSRFLKTVLLIILEIQYLLVCSNYVRKYDTITSHIPHLCSFFCGTFAWCFEITFTATFRLFVIVAHFLLLHNCVIALFDVVTFFEDIRITLYVGTFELHIEITLELRFVFVHHCGVFLITSQLRYLFVRCSYVGW